MGGRMAVWAFVAASDMAAGHALAEVNPPAADLETVLAPVARNDLRRRQGFDEVFAAVVHGLQCAIRRS